ncbi:MAG TPA: tetratricopeptide repeat protein, partial [Thermoanaerobaculia bacterium]|nr:tetratricopeptide repeat protein [Thermoanaerobaculia bacterium]
RLWRLHLPLLLVLGAGAAWRLRAFLGAESPVLPRAAAQNFYTELTVLWRYVGLLLWPAGQSLVHPAQRVASPLVPKVLLSAAALLLVAALGWRLRRRYPLAVFGLVWFFLFLAPSSTFVPLVELMAEHRLYLASGGIFLARGVGLGALSDWWQRTDRGPHAAPRALAAAIVAVLALLTVARNRVWADAVTLWQDAAAKAPLTWAPHYGLAQALRQRGDWNGAVVAYRRAVALRPDDNRARIDLAICLGQLGRYDEARAELGQVLAADPASADAFNNLGWLANRTRQPQEARQRFEQALAVDPGNVTARINLAMLEEQVFGRRAEALRLCREVEHLQPGIAAVAECIRRNEPAR